VFSEEKAAPVQFIPARARYAAFILALALVAALVVAFERISIERHTRSVEIAMDYGDFISLARSYNYKPEAFLVALRRAGLTSLAVQEELGSSINTARSAYATSGIGILDSARLSTVADPTLAGLVRSGKILPDEVYILVYDKPAFARYMSQLPLHFSPSSIRVLHNAAPWVIAVRTQLDYFGSISLGLPDDQVALAKKLDLFLIPRFQNDERLQAPQIAAMFDALAHRARVSTIVFFGLRNQVLGYPDHVRDTADVFRTRKLTFGSIETYDASQVQRGNDELAELIPGQTVRVQAIAKLEQDKLQFPEIVARYLLGARERNVRVVYLRPYAHQYKNLSIEGTNVELVRQIAGGLRARGFTLGHRASPVPLYRGNNRILVGVCALAVPALLVLLLALYGWYRAWMAAAAFAATVILYGAGIASHHDLLARSALALAAALLFSAAAFSALGPAFTEAPASTTGAQLARSLRWTVVATGIALLGALVVVGLMSSPLVMEEIERFRGVKAVLAVPPLLALVLYLFTDRFGAKINARALFQTPVGVGQLILGIAILGAAGLIIMRSGNQSDISPSSLELSLRSGLTTLLSVRPRFKEFLLGFPFLMLVPALLPAHRRAVGWLLAFGIGVGIGDVIDTFSHLHTPVTVSLLRVIIGLMIGCIIGAVAVAAYRRLYVPRTA